MIDSFIFYNYNGVTLEMNEETIPFRRFVMDVDIRNEERARAQESGMWPSPTFLGRRLFTIEGDLLAADFAPLTELRESIYEAVMPDPDTGMDASGTVEILFTGKSEPYLSEVVVAAYPEIAMDAATGAWQAFQLQLKSFDPWMLGKNLNKLTATSGETGATRTYNKTYNRTYAASAYTSNVVSVLNAGNYSTYPVVTFFGPGIGPELWFGSKQFTMRTLIVDAGESVVVDFRKRTAVMNDGTNVYNSIDEDSDWFRLPRGPSSLGLNWYLYVPGSYATVAWQNAYMV